MMTLLTNRAGLPDGVAGYFAAYELHGLPDAAFRRDLTAGRE